MWEKSVEIATLCLTKARDRCQAVLAKCTWCERSWEMKWKIWGSWEWLGMPPPDLRSCPKVGSNPGVSVTLSVFNALTKLQSHGPIYSGPRGQSSLSMTQRPIWFYQLETFYCHCYTLYKTVVSAKTKSIVLISSHRSVKWPLQSRSLNSIPITNVLQKTNVILCILLVWLCSHHYECVSTGRREEITFTLT